MAARNILVESLRQVAVEDQLVELVERKGVGHPDSICDAIMERISVALSQEYRRRCGRIRHHNVDKGLLVAGRVRVALGGGRLLEPMKLVMGDRATYEAQGVRIPVGEIAEETARQWLKTNLRYVDPARHITFQNEIWPGAAELVDIFDRETMGANDTSAAVGYAPFTDTERLVWATERYLNSPEFKQQFPETGEDVKVMGVRQGRELLLTVAMAFVDQFIDSEGTYFRRKGEALHALQEFVTHQEAGLERVDVALNTLDEPGRGLAGMYLSVLGTSADGGDSGQVGRGNRVNGVISLNRPMGTEAAAGKNPVAHVGKIYTLLSHRIADEVYRQVPGLREVYVWLCSQIGAPIDQPLIASAQLTLLPGIEVEQVAGPIRAVIDNELSAIQQFTDRLARGEIEVV